MTDYYSKHQEERKAYQREYYRKRMAREKDKLRKEQKMKELIAFSETIKEEKLKSIMKKWK